MHVYTLRAYSGLPVYTYSYMLYNLHWFKAVIENFLEINYVA